MQKQVETGSESETLRWPTNLDHPAIVQRLLQVRDMARAAGLAEIADRFAGIEAMAAGRIGASVIGALTWIQEKPEHREIATRLEMVAVNLRNLR